MKIFGEIGNGWKVRKLMIIGIVKDVDDDGWNISGESVEDL